MNLDVCAMQALLGRDPPDFAGAPPRVRCRSAAAHKPPTHPPTPLRLSSPPSPSSQQPAGAYAIYASGNNSVRSTGALRTLQSWAADDLSGEPFAGPFVAAFGPAYLDAWVVGLANGTDAELKTPAERAAALGSALQGPVQSAYFMHEVDEALAKVRAGDAAGRDAATGAPHNLDEAWGIWAGRGDGGACTLSGLAARAAEGDADADAAVLAAMEDAYAASLSGDAAALERAREALVREAVVAPQTRLLLAGAAAIDAAAAAGEPTAALQAETAAHFRSIWPLVGADSPAARAVLEALNVGGAPAEGVAAAVRAAAPEWADSAVAAAAAPADAPATSAAPAAPMAGAPASAAAARTLALAPAAAFAIAAAAALAAL
jgi:hypothetical protein